MTGAAKAAIPPSIAQSNANTEARSRGGTISQNKLELTAPHHEHVNPNAKSTTPCVVAAIVALGNSWRRTSAIGIPEPTLQIAVLILPRSGSKLAA